MCSSCWCVVRASVVGSRGRDRTDRAEIMSLGYAPAFPCDVSEAEKDRRRPHIPLPGLRGLNPLAVCVEQFAFSEVSRVYAAASEKVAARKDDEGDVRGGFEPPTFHTSVDALPLSYPRGWVSGSIPHLRNAAKRFAVRKSDPSTYALYRLSYTGAEAPVAGLEPATSRSTIEVTRVYATLRKGHGREKATEEMCCQIAQSPQTLRGG